MMQKKLVFFLLLFPIVFLLLLPQKALGAETQLKCSTGHKWSFWEMTELTCESQNSFCQQACSDAGYFRGYASQNSCYNQVLPFLDPTGKNNYVESCSLGGKAYTVIFSPDRSLSGSNSYTLCTCTNDPPPSAVADFGIARNFFEIQGSLYNDINTNQCLDSKYNLAPCNDGNESAYTDPITVDIVDTNDKPYPVTIASDTHPQTGMPRRWYTTRDGINKKLPAGTYRISFGGLTGANTFTYPNTPNNTLLVTVGPTCENSGVNPWLKTNTNQQASCFFGDIISLNAGVTNLKPAWIQSIGSDIRWDSGFINHLPSANTYASIPGTGGMPGIIFSGAHASDFGINGGQASERKSNQFNWQVGSFRHPDLFTTSHALIPTSYTFLKETAEGSGIFPKDNIASLNDISAHGIYKAEGLTVNEDYRFPENQNFIILINGSLNINAKIIVPVGSTVVFSAKEDITVGRTVGEIQGLYSADEDFTVDTASSCPGTADSKLNVSGTVIANAGRRGGTFDNRRSLCSGNSTAPSVTFTERPDFMLNYPSMVKQIPRYWQEVAP